MQDKERLKLEEQSKVFNYNRKVRYITLSS